MKDDALNGAAVIIAITGEGIFEGRRGMEGGEWGGGFRDSLAASHVNNDDKNENDSADGIIIIPTTSL